MSLKFVEIAVLLIAAGCFVGWQLWDLRMSREKTRLQRQDQERKQDQESPGEHHAP